jgi:hypothetical protein
MIANKHTELRLVSNLNDLLEDSKTKQEINKKIHKHSFEYMMSYISDNDLEDVNFYDKLEELSTHYQKHCYKIAKEVKEEILEENGEEIEIIKSGFEGYDPNAFRCQKVEKEIFLNPKKFTQDFKNNLEEDLTKLVIDIFFKELDNVVKVVEYRKKIDNLRKKDRKNIVESNKEDIKFLINARINKGFEFYLKKANGNAKLVLDNFSLVQDIIDDLFDDVIECVQETFDDNISKSDIESMFNKQLKLFVKEKRALITPTQYEQQPTIIQQTNVRIPKSVIAYGVAKIWEDITK